MPRVIVVSPNLRHDGRHREPGEVIDITAKAWARLGPDGSGAVALVRDDGAGPGGIAPAMLSDLGWALDLVAATFEIEVQEVCAVLIAHGEQRDTGGAPGNQPEPAAAGMPPIEGPEAGSQDVPPVKAGPAATGIVPVEQPQETPETGAAAPASAPTKPSPRGKGKNQVA